MYTDIGNKGDFEGEMGEVEHKKVCIRIRLIIG
jgi:hypothetical protein